MTGGLDRVDRFRDEAMAFAARPGVVFKVQIRHVDRETLEEARAWNQSIEGMAGVAVRNEEGELLFIHNEGYGGWVLPGGRVEEGESFRAGAVREVREESGVETRLCQPLFVYHLVNRFEGRSTDSSLVIFEGEAVDPEPAENPGVADESITDVQWCSTVPEPYPDDEFSRETIGRVADRFESVDRPKTL